MATIKSYRLKSGLRYYVRYMKPDGSQGLKRGFHTAEAARFWASEVEVKKHDGSYIDPKFGRVRLSTLAEPWLAMKKGKLKPSAYAPLEAAWRNHVQPKWGDWQLAKIETTDVEDWITWMVSEIRDDDDPEKILKKKYSATTVIRAHSVLASLLDRAVRDRKLAANKARVVENMPRKAPKRKVYLTHQQVADFADHMPEEWQQTLVFLAAYCGPRWGEIVGLRVSDLDLLRRRISINRNVVQVGGQFEVGTPKGGKSRTVALPLFIVEMLAKLAEGKAREALLFPGPTGDWLRRPNSERGWFVAAARKLGVPELTPHDLRHTAASLAVQSGASVKAVQAMLGHEKASMTLDVYADLFDDDLDQVASALDAARSRAIG
ncbi:tyrosine integrase [Gordonia phage Finkle]|uniref:Tyrosine integrase n=1 Tax=Gordonia phage Finkle TaxID=2926099 RepID=A0A9E7NJY3_9CAUD|nr:tyrosine integrase [Gordonia phage Finkle]UTN92959.1 tyrosine integrase [Gordonia phage Finkle]